MTALRPGTNRCYGTGRVMCSWCGARWPDELCFGPDGETPPACPACPVRAPELRDPPAEELRAAALAWDAKWKRGDVPELGVHPESPYRGRIVQLERQVYVLSEALRSVLSGLAGVRESCAAAERDLRWVAEDAGEPGEST